MQCKLDTSLCDAAPACTKTGVSSSVCISVGSIASFISTCTKELDKEDSTTRYTITLPQIDTAMRAKSGTGPGCDEGQERHRPVRCVAL